MSTCRNIFKAILKSSEMECGLQSYDNEKYMIYLCRDQDQDVLLHIPGCMVIGGVEVFCGVLIWILPVPGAQVVGGFMIGDGITRTLDGVTEMSEKNQQRQANRSPWH